MLNVKHLKPRIWIWTAGLAFVGYAIAGKSAIENVQAELIGVFVGAAIGFIIGWTIQRRVQKSTHRGS
jgi:membrane protein DedA with SNARE-associated domain